MRCCREIMSILSKIKKYVGKNKRIEPIIDKNIYERSFASYAGNSLSGSNILIVSNLAETLLTVEIAEQLDAENCYFKMALNAAPDTFEDKLHIALGDMLGPFDHIINVFDFSAYENEDLAVWGYQILQKECNFLFAHKREASICTIIRINTDSSVKVISESCALVNMLKGLGPVLANHKIICNGVCSDETVDNKTIMAAAVFMLSKYGKILTGEVIELGGK